MVPSSVVVLRMLYVLHGCAPCNIARTWPVSTGTHCRVFSTAITCEHRACLQDPQKRSPTPLHGMFYFARLIHPRTLTSTRFTMRITCELICLLLVLEQPAHCINVRGSMPSIAVD